MDKKEIVVYFQHVEIVDPQDFGPVSVHDLLVQKGFLEEKFSFTEVPGGGIG
jgi:hypothetical protein